MPKRPKYTGNPTRAPGAWSGNSPPESLARGRELEACGRATGLPVVTGDCVSPVLARVCGMPSSPTTSWHVVANWGTGLEPEDPTVSLDRLYLERLPGVAATLELGLLDRLAEPTRCRCRALLRERPHEYVRALSRPAPR